MIESWKILGRHWANVARILVAAGGVAVALGVFSAAEAKPMSESQRSKACASALAAGQIAIWDGGAWYDCTGETIVVTEPPGPGCGVLLECTGGGGKKPGGGEPGGGGGGGGTGPGDDGGGDKDCQDCEDEGDTCMDNTQTFQAICLHRFQQLARHHCETYKTDYRGLPLTNYECHTVEVELEWESDFFGKPVFIEDYVCEGPGIEKCVEDFGKDHPGSGLANTIGAEFSLKELFGSTYSEAFTLTWGGTNGYRSQCLGKSGELVGFCVTEQTQCTIEAKAAGDYTCKAATTPGMGLK